MKRPFTRPRAPVGGSLPVHGCGTRLTFGTTDGVCWQWCPSCRMDATVPIIGRRRYPQAAAFRVEIKAAIARACKRVPQVKRHAEDATRSSAPAPFYFAHPWKQH